MKVELEHQTTRGGFLWLTPFYEVRVYCTFTDDELRIIKDANLYGYEVAERAPHPYTTRGMGEDTREHLVETSTLTLLDLTKNFPDGWAFPTFPAAKAYEERVIEGLRRIKELIETNRNPLRFRREIIE